VAAMVMGLLMMLAVMAPRRVGRAGEYGQSDSGKQHG